MNLLLTDFFQSNLLMQITSSLYFKIGIIFVIIIALYLFWQKSSPIKCLLAAIINGIYGILLLSTITQDTPGLIIILIVAGTLTLFGIWGFILWTKTTVKKYEDNINHIDAMENWWSTIRAFDIILIIGLVFRIFILQPFIVEGPSMEPNFRDREAIMVDKLSFRLREPHRGEVIIFKAPPQPTDDYIKRVIAFPGEIVTIDKGKVYINGKLLDEKYLSATGKIPETANYFQKTIDSNEYFVMGDNRPESSDSRSWGTVPKENLIGRAILAVYPLDMFGLIELPKY